MMESIPDHGSSSSDPEEQGGKDAPPSCRRLPLGLAWLLSVAAAGALGAALGGRASPTMPPARQAEALAGGGFYGLYEGHILSARHVDLTHAVSPESPVWPCFGPSHVMAAVAGANMEGFVKKGEAFAYGKQGFEATSYHLTTDQLGTQLDPPAHWNELGATISDVPATVALRPLVVIDIHEKVKTNSSYHANRTDLSEWELKYGLVPAGSVVMIRSDWHKGWNSFFKKGLPATFPGVDLDLLKFLHNERKILFHGHEPLDTDMTPTLEGEAWLMHNNFMQAEGVANLDQVPEAGCLLSIGFAKLLGGTGGYARYVAICPPTGTGGATIADAPGAPLATQSAPLRRGGDGVLRPLPEAAPTKYCGEASAALGCVGGAPVW